MKRIAMFLGLTALLSTGFYYLTIQYLPNYIYHKFYTKVVNSGDRKVNEFTMTMAPDETSRLVVKPNPDFAYASAFFDVSDRPIRITGDMPDSTYWSVAMYYPNTINFFVKNDLQFDSSSVDISLGTQGQNTDVVAKTDKGFILIRLLIAERDEYIQQHMLSYLESLTITYL